MRSRGAQGAAPLTAAGPGAGPEARGEGGDVFLPFRAVSAVGRRGQTTVEFAVAAVVLFVFLFAIIDLSLMLYVNLTMQRAVREGTRFAVTGQPGSGGDRRVALAQQIRDSSSGLYDLNALTRKEPTVSVLKTSETSDVFGNYTGTPVADTGKPEQIIIVRLTYAWPLLTPMIRPFFADGNYTFVASSTMRNENWGP